MAHTAHPRVGLRPRREQMQVRVNDLQSGSRSFQEKYHRSYCSPFPAVVNRRSHSRSWMFMRSICFFLRYFSRQAK